MGDSELAMINNSGRRNILLTGALVALLAACFALIGAAPASAQSPAACEEYDDPNCGPDGGEDPIDVPGANGDNGTGDGDGDGDGELPFTGYPLTGLILLFLVLLLAGLALRGGAALREKLARGPSSS